MKNILTIILLMLSAGIVCGQTAKQMVAVLPTVGDVDDDINGAVQDALEQGVLKSLQYGLVARGPAFSQALSEMEFQASGAVDDSQLTEFGHAVSADFVCYANIRAIANTFRITYRLVNVSTAEIAKVNSRNSSNRVDDFINVLDEIAEELFGNTAERLREEEKRQAQLRAAEEEREKTAKNVWSDLKLSSDIEALESFIAQYGGTSPVAEANERLKDEKAWALTRQTNTLGAYERYYAAGSSARYQEQAKDWLEEAYYRIALDAAQIADFDKIDMMYDNCLLLSPYGRIVDEIKNLKCSTYYNQAVKLSKNKKNVADLKQANEYFNIAKQTCTTTSKDLVKYMENNEKIIRKAK